MVLHHYATPLATLKVARQRRALYPPLSGIPYEPGFALLSTLASSPPRPQAAYQTPLTPPFDIKQQNQPANPKKQGSRKKMKSDRFSIPFVIQCIAKSNEVTEIDNY